MIEGEQLNSGVEQELEVSQEPQTPVVENSNQEPAKAVAPEPSAAEKPTPFHEHPRWKELIEERNSTAAQLKEMQAQLASFREREAAAERKRAEEADPQRKLVDRLKGIDPEFGTWAEQQEAARREYQLMSQRLKAFEQQQLQSQAEATLEKIHNELKIPAELQSFYRAQAQVLASQTPGLGLKDLPGLYQKIHSQFNTYIENLRRADREAYLTDKKQTSAAPASQPKGAPVPKAKETFPNDPDAARRKIVADVLKQTRAQKPENVN